MKLFGAAKVDLICDLCSDGFLRLNHRWKVVLLCLYLVNMVLSDWLIEFRVERLVA